jgi:hypothetical protein
MSVEQARRLWDLLPQSVQAILEHGPQLLDVLVPGEALAGQSLRCRALPVRTGWMSCRGKSPGGKKAWQTGAKRPLWAIH